MSDLSPEEISRIMAENRAAHQAFLDKEMDRLDWLDLLHRCQNGEVSCAYVATKIEYELKKRDEEIAKMRATIGKALEIVRRL